jgi:hypothetical protein
MQLDKGEYQTFDLSLPAVNTKITVVQFEDANPVTTFSEITGFVREAVADRVTFYEDPPPNLKFVNSGIVVSDNPTPLFILTFDRAHTYMWKNHKGDAAAPIYVASPTKGGKSKRRKYRRSRPSRRPSRRSNKGQ